MVIGFFLSPRYHWVFQSISDIFLNDTVDLYLFFYSFDWYGVTQTTAFRLLLLISLLTHRRFYLRDYTAEFSVEDSSAHNIYQEVQTFVNVLCRIDISKYKHDCCIISAANQKIISKVIIANNKAGFDELLTIINSLSDSEDIRI